MKITSLNDPKSFIVVLIWSLFMGVTAISIGFGAAFPALNQIAQPFVCSTGHMQVLMSTSHPQPGTTYTSEKWQCVDNRTGQAQPVNELSMFLVNGLIYGTILFAVIYLWWWIRMNKTKRQTPQSIIDANAHNRLMPAMQPGQMLQVDSLPHVISVDSAEGYELQELTRLHKAGQFSEAEYLRKRAKILNRVTDQSIAATSDDDPVVDELRKLKKLLTEGLITEVDYEQKKAAILNRL